MPNCKTPVRYTVTPGSVYLMFMKGVDTLDIAERFGIPEHEAYKLLRFAFEAKRLFNDPNRDSLSPVDEPPVEGH